MLNKSESIKIMAVKDNIQKEKIITICDKTFQRGLLLNENAEVIIKKIETYAEFICAYYNEEIAGYAAIYANDMEKRKAYISMFGVLKEYQNKHVGSNLMKQCIITAKNKGMDEIRLEVVNDNAVAINFYKKHGFVFDGICSEHSSYMKRVLA